MQKGFALSIALLTTPAAAQLDPSPAPPAEEEIVVIARKMRQIEVDIKLGRKGGLVSLRACRITRGSGRAELDLVPCEMAQICLADGVTARKALVQCVETRSEARADAILAAWRASAGEQKR